MSYYLQLYNFGLIKFDLKNHRNQWIRKCLATIKFMKLSKSYLLEFHTSGTKCTMETTFGKTVETRFVENYSSKSYGNYKTKMCQENLDTEKQIATDNIFNLNNNIQFQINYQKMQKYKHDILYLKLKQHNQKQADLEKRINSSMRKQYVYTKPINGYQSDSEYFYKMPNNLIRHDYEAKEAIDDETRSCVSMRTSNDRHGTMRSPRYKSLERSKVSESFRKYSFKQIDQNQDLSWKTFNYNPNYGVLSNRVDENLNGYKSRNAIIKKNQSISTPGTPLINSNHKKYNTNCFENDKFLNEQEVIVLGQNEIDIQLKNIENLKKQHFQMDFKKSGQNTEHKSQLEVVSLENALLSMNEILRNLTLNTKKRDEILENSMDKNQLSPPLSTSTSFSTSENESKSKKSQSENVTPISISPSSSANDYSNSGIDEVRINKTSSSFYPSDSSASCTNSFISRHSISEVHKRLSVDSVDKSELVRESKKSRLSLIFLNLMCSNIKQYFFNELFEFFNLMELYFDTDKQKIGNYKNFISIMYLYGTFYKAGANLIWTD
ncbi:hypothetical protein BpHYR1_034842 [Brachionus plicatilis]|uniref:Uncharacterized protein n=1 Tax=Brachionus plicatilis TaxID=10195 RepID=A0A3M7TBF8_BRAPC|nr:hypothetical protein BpHYR1_034842 [Brachionus plicatilis]